MTSLVVVGANPPRGEGTRVRQQGTRVTMPKTPAERIAAVRQIVAEHQYAKIDGHMVDGFSASAIVQVYDALNDVNKAKYAAMPVDKMAAVAFKLMKDNPPTRGRRNPPDVLPEGHTLGKVLRELRALLAFVKPEGQRDILRESIAQLEALQQQAARGIHRNPPGEQLARKVLRLDYVHAEDGKAYKHDFAEDPSTVTATVVEDGRKIILKAVDGRKIVADY